MEHSLIICYRFSLTQCLLWNLTSLLDEKVIANLGVRLNSIFSVQFPFLEGYAEWLYYCFMECILIKLFVYLKLTHLCRHHCFVFTTNVGKKLVLYLHKWAKMQRIRFLILSDDWTAFQCLIEVISSINVVVKLFQVIVSMGRMDKIVSFDQVNCLDFLLWTIFFPFSFFCWACWHYF